MITHIEEFDQAIQEKGYVHISEISSRNVDEIVKRRIINSKLKYNEETQTIYPA